MRALYPVERMYLLEAARGLTAQQTAKKHDRSVNTVNTSLKSAKAALNADNIAHAVALAIVYGEFGRDEILGGLT